MGDAMDFITPAENSIVVMIHLNKAGKIKNSNTGTLPLIGLGFVKKGVAELVVLEITLDGFKLLERVPGLSVEEIIQVSVAELIKNFDIPEMIIE